MPEIKVEKETFEAYQSLKDIIKETVNMQELTDDEFVGYLLSLLGEQIGLINEGKTLADTIIEPEVNITEEERKEAKKNLKNIFEDLK